MDQDKENVPRFRISTRIPIPKQPLPPLPKHLLTSTKSKNVETQRGPLRTLNHANSDAGTSESNANYIKKRVHSLNTKHVTRRQKYEPLNWNFNSVNEEHEKIGSDKNKDTTSENAGKCAEVNFLCKNDPRRSKCTDEKNKITVSEEPGSTFILEDNQFTSTYTVVENKDALTAGDIKNKYVWESSSAMTPAIQSLEHIEMRNIKRSLKRPHSRELQGLSLVENHDQANYIKFKKHLEFKLRSQNSMSTPDLSKKKSTCLVHNYTPEIFKYLLSIERSPLDVPKVDNDTRACVINWLIKINGSKGNPAVVQCASWYLDSTLGMYAVTVDKLQLFAASCYWIARKLHGSMITAGSLVRLANNAFNKAQLLEVEKYIMEKLRFPPQPVVPNDYITYLASYCTSTDTSPIEISATFIYMSGLVVDKKLCEEVPSVLAAAAVRDALLIFGDVQLLDQLKSCPVYQDIEKKSNKMDSVSFRLRHALLTIAHPTYEYKAPLDHYKGPPNYIADQIIINVNNLADTA